MDTEYTVTFTPAEAAALAALPLDHDKADLVSALDKVRWLHDFLESPETFANELAALMVVR